MQFKANCISPIASCHGRPVVSTIANMFFNVLITCSTCLLALLAPVAVRWTLICLLSQNSWNSLPVKHHPWSAIIRQGLPNKNIADLSALIVDNDRESILRVWCSYTNFVKASTKTMTYPFVPKTFLNLKIFSKHIWFLERPFGLLDAL